LKKVKLSAAFSLREDETASITNIAIPAPHYLESWNDLMLTKGTYSLTQPTIRPLFSSKQFQEALLSWNGNSADYHDYIKANAGSYTSGTSWNQTVHDGVVVGVSGSAVGGSANFAAAASALAQSTPTKGFELVLYTKTGLGDGQQANNPWLQEFPDPITRVSWDNYVTISQADADSKELGFENKIVANGGLNGSYATLTVNGIKLENVPVIIQPGQAKGTLGMALGYGKMKGLNEEMQVGLNAYAFYAGFNNVQSASITKGSGEHHKKR
jgi:molybdopterin-containing oxidoreductase family iron-sulfur binding subunit